MGEPLDSACCGLPSGVAMGRCVYCNDRPRNGTPIIYYGKCHLASASEDNKLAGVTSSRWA